jgi:hypothetical protein
MANRRYSRLQVCATNLSCIPRTKQYDRDIRPNLKDPKESNNGKFVAIAIETGSFEIDSHDYTATERVLADHPRHKSALFTPDNRGAYRIRMRP